MENILPENCWYQNVCKLYGSTECDEFCLRFAQMRYMINESNLPKRLCKNNALVPPSCDLTAYQQLLKIKLNIFEFVKSGKSLYLFSENPGNGKTTWTAKLMLSYFDKVWETNCYKERGVFVQTTKLLEMASDFQQLPELAKQREKLERVDLVVWDDIALHKLTDKEFKVLYAIINERLLKGLSNIYTGNYKLETLTTLLGPRLASRVWGDSVRIEFQAPDLRGS